MRKALDEFINYKNTMMHNIKKLEDEIKSNEIKLKELEEQYNNSVLQGKSFDTNTLDELNNALKADTRRYKGMLKSASNDIKLKELAENVFKEQYKAIDEIQAIKGDNNTKIAEIRKECDKKVSKIKNDTLKSIKKFKDEASERVQAIEYVENKKDNFTLLGAGYDYTQYIKNYGNYDNFKNKNWIRNKDISVYDDFNNKIR